MSKHDIYHMALRGMCFIPIIMIIVVVVSIVVTVNIIIINIWHDVCQYHHQPVGLSEVVSATLADNQ